MENKTVIVYSTFSSREDASRIGKVLLTEKLAGCVNIFDNVHSLYAWEGKLQEDVECATYIKTTRDASSALISRLKELHPYEIPVIFALETVITDAGYVRWLEKQVENKE